MLSNRIASNNIEILPARTVSATTITNKELLRGSFPPDFREQNAALLRLSTTLGCQNGEDPIEENTL